MPGIILLIYSIYIEPLRAGLFVFDTQVYYSYMYF